MIKKVCVFVLLLGFYSNCQDGESKFDNKSKSIFTRSTGNEISIETAERWVKRHREHASGRDESFSIATAKLNEMLDGTSDELGVVLHHAFNLKGDHHILLTPIQEELKLWNEFILDLNTNGFVDAASAATWSEAYKQENAAGPWSHYFGIEIFEEIVAKNGLQRIEVIEAENDLQVPQLLLYAYYITLENGRMKSEEVKVYDGSAVCPPTCAENL